MFSLAELAIRLGKTDISGWMKGNPANQLKQSPDWVEAFLGFSESAAVSKGTQLETKQSIDNMLAKYAIYDVESGVLATPQGKFQAGWFVCPTVNEIKAIVTSLDGVLKKGRPRVRVAQGVDAGGLIADGPQLGIYQAASQANGLEMIDSTVLPRDGIKKYEEDGTQGPIVAMTGGPGTFVRNYWVGQQLGGQFNSLYELNLDHVNGYLIWGTEPMRVKTQLMGNEGKIRIPAMLYTQLAGKAKGTHHLLNKLVHQIYTCSAPIDAYGNNGTDAALDIARTMLTAAYIGIIGLGLILRTWDAQRGLNNPIHLTLVGGGAFHNPAEVIVGAIKTALDTFSGYDFDVVIHDYSGGTTGLINNKLAQYVGGGTPFDNTPFGGPPFGNPQYGGAPAPVGPPFDNPQYGGPPFGGAIPAPVGPPFGNPQYGGAPAPVGPPFGNPQYGGAPAPVGPPFKEPRNTHATPMGNIVQAPSPAMNRIGTVWLAPEPGANQWAPNVGPDIVPFVPTKFDPLTLGQGQDVPPYMIGVYNKLSQTDRLVLSALHKEVFNMQLRQVDPGKIARIEYLYNCYVNYLRKNPNPPNNALINMGGLVPYTLQISQNRAMGGNGLYIPGARWGLGALPVPTIDDLYVTFYDLVSKEHRIFRPRNYQFEMIKYFYALDSAKHQYSAGALQYTGQGQPILNGKGVHVREVEAFLFKYLSQDYPIIGFENEDGNKIYVIDMRFHANRSDPLHPVHEVVDARPNPGFTALSTRTGNFETSPYPIFGI